MEGDEEMKLEIQLDEPALDRAIGEAAAAEIRASGRIPEDTGELERSIRYDPLTHSVRALGTHTGGSSNAVILASNAKRLRTNPLEPTAAMRRAAVKAAEKEIRRQVQAGRAKVVRR